MPRQAAVPRATLGGDRALTMLGIVGVAASYAARGARDHQPKHSRSAARVTPAPTGPSARGSAGKEERQRLRSGPAGCLDRGASE